MKYFSLVGSYFGGIKIKGHWVRVHDLNRIDKIGWDRHQGPLTPAMAASLKQQSTRADVMFPSLKKGESK